VLAAGSSRRANQLVDVQFGTDERVLDVECLQTGMPHGIKFRVASSGEVDCPNASAQRVESWGVTCEFEGAGVLDVVEFNVYERK
jgi:hypothetical protein